MVRPRCSSIGDTVEEFRPAREPGLVVPADAHVVDGWAAAERSAATLEPIATPDRWWLELERADARHVADAVYLARGDPAARAELERAHELLARITTTSPTAPPAGGSELGGDPAGGAGTMDPADVAILIALREEWDVFWPIAGKPRGVKDPDSGRYLFRFEVVSEVGRPYRCVALCMGDMGPGQATDASHVLLQGKPRTVVNLGIAAAIHDDLELCDVVVADQVDDYFATAKAAARGKEEYSFELRGSVYKASYSLVQDVDSLQYAHPEAFEAWHSACSVAMTEHAEKIARAMSSEQIREHPGLARAHLASGPVLAAAASFSRWVRTRDGLLKALEMESAGMMLAAHQRSDPTSTLVLRGISDFGDERKAKTERKSGGAFRYLAMFNATRLLWAMLGRGLLRRHEPGRGATGSVPEIVVVTLLQYGDHFRLSDPPPFASEAGAELWSHFQRVGEQDTTNVWLNQEFSRLFPGETYKPFDWGNGFAYDAPYLIMLFAAHGWDHHNTMYEPGGQASHTPSDVYTLFFRRHRVEKSVNS